MFSPRVLVFLTIAMGLAAIGLTPRLAQQPVDARAAQSDEREALIDHPLVGVWRWDNDLVHPNTRITYGVFHADGSYLEVTTGAGTSVGVWRASGENSADVTSVFQDYSEDPMVVEPGASIARMTVDIDADGIAHALFTFDVRQLDGTIEFQGGPYEAIGTRVEVEKMVPFDTQTMGTPVA